jgi:hypothetical protein
MAVEISQLHSNFPLEELERESPVPMKLNVSYCAGRLFRYQD